MRAQHAPALIQLLHLQGGQLGTHFGLGPKIWVSHRLLGRAQALPHGVCPQKPQACGDLQRVFKARVHLFHMRTQRLQLLHRQIDRRCDLGVHIFGVTQGG